MQVPVLKQTVLSCRPRILQQAILARRPAMCAGRPDRFVMPPFHRPGGRCGVRGLSGMVFTAADPAFEAVVDTSSPIERIASNFVFTEGPVWHPVGKYLLFSDIPASVRRRWDPKGGAREILKPTNKANGLTFDAEVNLLACEHVTSSVVRFNVGGEREVLCSHFDGKELNSPNDIVVRADNSIYFTDPPYGRLEGFGELRDQVLDFQGVFRIPPGHAPGSEPELVVDRGVFSKPNGLCLSPDESLLYVNDTEQANIRVFDIAADGSLSGGRVFAEGIEDDSRPGRPDGMKCDEIGNVWVTGPAGIWVYAADGKKLGEVSFPEVPANFCFGGDDWRTVFATAGTLLYSCRAKVGPKREPFMRAVSSL